MGIPKGRKGWRGSTGGPAQVGRGFQRAGSVGRGWEALPESRERSGGPPRGSGGIEKTIMWYRQELEGIGRPTQRAERDCEALPKGRERLRGLSGGPEEARTPSQKTRWGWESPKKGGEEQEVSRISRRGQEALLEGWEWLGVPRGESGGFVRLSWMDGRSGKPSQRDEKGLEVIPEGQERLADPPGLPEKVESRWVAHLEGRKVSEDPFVGSVRVPRPSRRAGSGREPRPRWPIEVGSPPRRAEWIGSLSRKEGDSEAL